jgi:hypothetical protein
MARNANVSVLANWRSLRLSPVQMKKPPAVKPGVPRSIVSPARAGNLRAGLGWIRRAFGVNAGRRVIPAIHIPALRAGFLASGVPIVALRAQWKPLRAIAEAVAAKGHRLSHEGVAGVLRSAGI